MAHISIQAVDCNCAVSQVPRSSSAAIKQIAILLIITSTGNLCYNVIVSERMVDIHTQMSAIKHKTNV
jgi:hypothetical protein